jgi:hypothetical protein
MEKIYLLICVNGDGELTNVDSFKTMDEAHDEMVRAIEAEVEDAHDGGWEDDDIYVSYSSDTHGHVHYGDDSYDSYDFYIETVKNPFAE